jgi:hypothetical protein
MSEVVPGSVPGSPERRQERDREIQHAYLEEGLSIEEIAERVCLAPVTVWRILHRLDTPMRPRGNRPRPAFELPAKLDYTEPERTYEPRKRKPRRQTPQSETRHQITPQPRRIPVPQPGKVYYVPYPWIALANAR